MNRCLEERIRSIIRLTRIDELGTTLAVTSNWRTRTSLLITANVVRSSPFLFTLMMEVINLSESSVHTRATRRNTPQYVILHSHRRDNFESYRFCVVFEAQKKDVRKVKHIKEWYCLLWYYKRVSQTKSHLREHSPIRRSIVDVTETEKLYFSWLQNKFFTL
jgi:hypothetical protein